MGSDELIIGATDLLIKFDVRRAPQTAPVRVLVKNAADEERIISDVGAQQECLLWRRAGERDEHIGDVFVRATPKAFASPDHFGVVNLVRALQLVRARESFEQRADIIAKLAITDPGLLQDVPSQDIKIKLGRDVEMFRMGKNGLD